jgi:enolase
MLFIKTALLGQILGDRGQLVWRLWLNFSDGQAVIKYLPDTCLPNSEPEGGWLSLDNLQGFNLEDDWWQALELLDFSAEMGSLNFILYLQLACAEALAIFKKHDLYNELAIIGQNSPSAVPLPIITFFYGAANQENHLDFAEYLWLPSRKNRESCHTHLALAAKIDQELAHWLTQQNSTVAYSLNGAFLTTIKSSVKIFDGLSVATVKSGAQLGDDIVLGVRVGAGQLYNHSTGKYHFMADQLLHGSDLHAIFSDWQRQYHVAYLEDAVDIADEQSAQDLFQSLSTKMWLVANQSLAGDELLLRSALQKRDFNAIALNLKDFANLSHLFAFKALAAKHQLATALVSEPNNNQGSSMADLAVALGVDYVRFGSLIGRERAMKYNRLMDIEQKMANS